MGLFLFEILFIFILNIWDQVDTITHSFQRHVSKPNKNKSLNGAKLNISLYLLPLEETLN